MSIFGTPATSLKNVFGGSGTVSSDAINTSVGDLIIACFFGSTSGGTPAVSPFGDTAGNTYHAETLQLDGSSAQFSQWFWTIATNASASNVLSGGYVNGFVVAIGVLDIPLSGGTPTRDTLTAMLVNSTTTTPASPSFNTTGTDEFIAAVEADAGSEPTITAGTGYTLVNPSGLTFPRANMEYGQFSSGPSLGITAGFNGSSAFSCSISAIAFKAGGGPPPPSSGAPVVVIMQ